MFKISFPAFRRLRAWGALDFRVGSWLVIGELPPSSHGTFSCFHKLGVLSMGLCFRKLRFYNLQHTYVPTQCHLN